MWKNIFSGISTDCSEYSNYLSTDSNKKQNEDTHETFMIANCDTANKLIENFDIHNMPIQFIDGSYSLAGIHNSGKFFSSDELIFN